MRSARVEGDAPHGYEARPRSLRLFYALRSIGRCPVTIPHTIEPMPEVFLPFRTSIVELATEVRSTLIMAGIQTVRARGLFSRYSESLSPEARERILGLAAGIWVPVDVAVTHYTAMDRLGIDQSTIESIGAEVAARTWKHIMAPTFARAKRVGRQPWEHFRHAHDTLTNTWRGSDVQVFKESPTQALCEWAGQPCAAIPYFVASYGSYMRALTNLFSSRAFYRIVPERCSRTTLAVRLSWVEGEPRETPQGVQPSPPIDAGPSVAAPPRGTKRH
jgi:hypothetical protein